MQKVLRMETEGSSLRSSAHGWQYEDGDGVSEAFLKYGEKYHFDINRIPVGLIGHGSQPFHCHSTPLHALGDGWRLLSPPKKHKWKNSLNDLIVHWEWWFVKE
jgi:hypothetical protein